MGVVAYRERERWWRRETKGENLWEPHAEPHMFQ
jgi:hypothetical protein